MQRIISTSLLIVLLGLIILSTGCGGGKRAAMVQQQMEKKAEGTIDVPEWFLNPPQELSQEEIIQQAFDELEKSTEKR